MPCVVAALGVGEGSAASVRLGVGVIDEAALLGFGLADGGVVPPQALATATSAMAIITPVSRYRGPRRGRRGAGMSDGRSAARSVGIGGSLLCQRRSGADPMVRARAKIERSSPSLSST